MAHLIRPWQVRYFDREGKRCPADVPGAKRVRQRARKWYGAGIPGLPSGKRIPLATDRNVARAMLAELVKKGERGEAGLTDAVSEARDVPLSVHLQTFERHLTYRHVSPKQVKLLLTRLRTTFDACGFSLASDLSADAVAAYLSDRRGLPREAGGIGIQTNNFYLSALNQFCRWMARGPRPRMALNPFEGMQGGNVSLDRRHDRRDLDPSELGKVLGAVRESTWTFRGLAGPDRQCLYLTAAGTGLRVAELASLTPESFGLDADPPTVTVRAAHAKNKRPVTQPLPPQLVPTLRDYLADKPAGRPVWPGTWTEKAARMLAHDLEAVGIPYVLKGPDGPLFADFHSLRHCFITWLERSGVTPRTAQELARHSDIRLTLGRYTHANLAGLADAVEKLPLPVGGEGAAPHKPATIGDEVRQLRGTVEALSGLVGCLLVALRVALNPEKTGDGPGRPGTGTGGATRGRGRHKSV
jgi:integrase